MERTEDPPPNEAYEVDPEIRQKLENEKQDYLSRLHEGGLPSIIKDHLEQAVIEIDEILGVQLQAEPDSSLL